SEFTVCIYLRAWRSVYNGRLRQDGGADRGSGQAQRRSPPHASARLRLCPREQRTRYARLASVPWSQEYPAYGAVHRIESNAIERFWALGSAPTGQQPPRRPHSPSCDDFAFRPLDYFAPVKLSGTARNGRLETAACQCRRSAATQTQMRHCVVSRERAAIAG